jgi:uncharacterized repeat protein (TIGR03803 family)
MASPNLFDLRRIHMRSKKSFSISTLASALTMFALTVLLTASAAAQAEKVLHSFNDNGTDGVDLVSALIFDKTGNLYGTTIFGGTHASGTAFEILAAAGGGTTEKILYNFGASGSDGTAPKPGLIAGPGGRLYGVTTSGGTHNVGTVFALIPHSGGSWTEAVLYNFAGGLTDGAAPVGGLVIDASGNLYGTTANGGSVGAGTVFELSPPVSGGKWTETLLHIFLDNSTDGGYPQGSLAFDAAGNFYGTTNVGGNSGNCSPGCGTVFQLTPASGEWTETVIYNFTTANDGFFPISGLTFDTKGNLYGATTQGAFAGIFTTGAVFELSPAGGDVWNESIIYPFGNNADGASPAYGAPVFDADGNLYLTPTAGGTDNVGTVFELSPRAGGTWEQRVLHSFTNTGTDGQNPWSSLVLDTHGKLYGTTLNGGANCNCGTVFVVKP